MLFVCPWCNHLNEAEPVTAVKCNHCGRWCFTSDKPAPELPVCPRCGEKMHGTYCVKCPPKL